MKVLTLIVAFVLANYKISAQSNSIIPAPVSYKQGKGSFIVTPKTQLILSDNGEINTANFLNDYFQKFYGYRLNVSKIAKKNYIKLSTKKFIKAPDNESRYTLNVTSTSVIISGDSYAGTFNGMQTLLQLLPTNKQGPKTIAAVSIEDYPRFSYRGMHLDVGRHFFNVDYVKRYIDFIALHKMNTFHWHLTEDQGWRIEIKKYPKLTEIGGFRNGTIIGRYPGKGNDSIRYGGFYTQEEIKDVVKYAADRFITVIPEIEMPGHSSAAIAAYPELSCFPNEPSKIPAQTSFAGSRAGKVVQQTWGVFEDIYCPSEFTFKFLENVLDEVMALFPSQYIHIGGDEAPKDIWKRSPFCQQLIKEKGLKDEHGLQSYFVQRIEKYINSKGKKIIGWDEILEGGLAPNATVMSWQGEKGGIQAAKQNHDAIMTPEEFLYLNWSQNKNEDSVSFGRYTPIEKVYGYEPKPKELDLTTSTHILGAQGNLWTEYIKNTNILEYMLFPRMSALSEVVWSPKEKRIYKDFEKRLVTQFKRYNFWNFNFSTGYFKARYKVAPSSTTGVVNVVIDSTHFGESINSYQITSPPATRNVVENQTIATPLNLNISQLKGYTLPVKKSGIIVVEVGKKGALSQTLSTPLTDTLQFRFNKATGKKIDLKTTPSPTYPGNGGAFGLVNGLTAKQFNSTEWFGFGGKDMDATIDLSKIDSINTVTVNVWRQEPSWVYLPSSIDVYTSTDSSNWKLYSESENNQTTEKSDRAYSVRLAQKAAARYVRVVAHNYGIIPEGRQGGGRASSLFIDEIEVE